MYSKRYLCEYTTYTDRSVHIDTHKPHTNHSMPLRCGASTYIYMYARSEQSYSHRRMLRLFAYTQQLFVVKSQLIHIY